MLVNDTDSSACSFSTNIIHERQFIRQLITRYPLFWSHRRNAQIKATQQKRQQKNDERELARQEFRQAELERLKRFNKEREAEENRKRELETQLVSEQNIRYNKWLSETEKMGRLEQKEDEERETLKARIVEEDVVRQCAQKQKELEWKQLIQQEENKCDKERKVQIQCRRSDFLTKETLEKESRAFELIATRYRIDQEENHLKERERQQEVERNELWHAKGKAYQNALQAKQLELKYFIREVAHSFATFSAKLEQKEKEERRRYLDSMRELNEELNMRKKKARQEEDEGISLLLSTPFYPENKVSKNALTIKSDAISTATNPVPQLSIVTDSQSFQLINKVIQDDIVASSSQPQFEEQSPNHALQVQQSVSTCCSSIQQPVLVTIQHNAHLGDTTLPADSTTQCAKDLKPSLSLIHSEERAISKDFALIINSPPVLSAVETFMETATSSPDILNVNSSASAKFASAPNLPANSISISSASNISANTPNAYNNALSNDIKSLMKTTKTANTVTSMLASLGLEEFIEKESPTEVISSTIAVSPTSITANNVKGGYISSLPVFTMPFQTHPRMNTEDLLTSVDATASVIDDIDFVSSTTKHQTTSTINTSSQSNIPKPSAITGFTITSSSFAKAHSASRPRLFFGTSSQGVFAPAISKPANTAIKPGLLLGTKPDATIPDKNESDTDFEEDLDLDELLK